MATLHDWLTLAEEQDFLSSLFVAGLVVYVAQHAVRHDPAARRAGQLVAGLVLAIVVVGALARGIELGAVAGRALILCGLTLGLSWLLIPFLRAVHSRTTGVCLKSLRTAGETYRQRRTDARRRAAADRARREQATAWEQAAPERERQQQESEVLHAREQQAQQSRNDSRFRCLLFFDQHADGLAGKLSRAALDAYLATYLSDAESPECVQQRAELLCRSLGECLQSSAAANGAFGSLQELADHFGRQRDEVATTPFSADVRDTLLSTIARAQEAALREFFQS
ncbi:MAG: hypothetical protein WED34_09475 [Planctomycetales bacterium]